MIFPVGPQSSIGSWLFTSVRISPYSNWSKIFIYKRMLEAGVNCTDIKLGIHSDRI